MMKNSFLSVNPTNQTAHGPIGRFEGDELIVDYDYEGADKNQKWSRLVFLDVIAVEYRQFAACRAEDLTSATEVHQIDDSAWLSNVLSLWRESVGWQKWQRKLGGARRLKQFTVFFDNAGSINVVATECRITPDVLAPRRERGLPGTE
jgi:hypothetical protein